MRFIDLKLFLLLFTCVGAAVSYESPVRFRTLVETREPWDIAIVGEGYLQLFEEYSPDGCIKYTRAGKLQIDPNGMLFIPIRGKVYHLEPSITVPHDWKSVRIADDGSVFVTQSGTSSDSNIGQLQLAKFQINNAFADDYIANQQTEKHGQPAVSNPGTIGTGQLLQGWLEKPPESVVYRYAKPILVGSVLAIVLKLLLDAVLAQQKMQKLLQVKQTEIELE